MQSILYVPSFDFVLFLPWKNTECRDLDSLPWLAVVRWLSGRPDSYLRNGVIDSVVIIQKIPRLMRKSMDETGRPATNQRCEQESVV